jgi:hypothetical protein
MADLTRFLLGVFIILLLVALAGYAVFREIEP